MNGTLNLLSFAGLAVIHDDANEIESFVMRGADVNSYDRDGNTALLRAGYSLKRACLHKQVHSVPLVYIPVTDRTQP